MIEELLRVLRPGGLLALLLFSSQQLLPGHPELEARLNATASGIAPYRRGMSPDSHWLRALGWFRKAGLVECRAETFVRTVHAPLDQTALDALSALIEMRWANAKPQVSWPDWATFERLTQPDSPHFLLARPDYIAFFTYTLFWGRAP